ncbi:MAG: translation initiation factor IF-6 [Euryarchaeota archaeon]|nr:translation initiation factor IF-6 [Euryarchaeota archaeon]
MLLRVDYNSNPNIGILAVANDSIAVVPRDAPEEFVEAAGRALEVDVVRSNICGTSLIGAMLAINNRGAVVSDLAREEEVRELRNAGIEVAVVKERHNALGNLILASDEGALVFKGLRKATKRAVEEVMGCRVVEVTSLGRFRTVGSIGVATQKGALFHPSLGEAELELAEEALGVRAEIGTVNMGVGFVKTGIVVNSKGALLGSATTGPEIMRIQEAFELV